jgi:hypothetical protein
VFGADVTDADTDAVGVEGLDGLGDVGMGHDMISFCSDG